MPIKESEINGQVQVLKWCHEASVSCLIALLPFGWLPFLEVSFQVTIWPLADVNG